MSKEFDPFNPLAKNVSQFFWVIYDALLLLTITTYFLFYDDLKTEWNEVAKPFFVFVIWNWFITAAHLLAFCRHDDLQKIKKSNYKCLIEAGNGEGENAPELRPEDAEYKQFPGWISWGLFSGKFLLLSIFTILIWGRIWACA